jgi:FkbM family methyltransferase
MGRRDSWLLRYRGQLEIEGTYKWFVRKLLLAARQLIVKPSRQIKNLGVRGWFVFAIRRAAEFILPGSRSKNVFKLYPGRCSLPVRARHGTSDILAFSQVFAERQYAVAVDALEPRLIVDCGANVGYSTLYFLMEFPNADVVAVEPDPGNYELLKTNVSRFGDRVRVKRGAIWPYQCGLVLEEPDGERRNEWSRKVRPCINGEHAGLEGINPLQLLEQSGHERISIIKLDIEGSEVALFSSGDLQWLDKTDFIMIELHGPDCEAAFQAAIRARPFTTSRYGEHVICRRQHAKVHRVDQ